MFGVIYFTTRVLIRRYRTVALTPAHFLILISNFFLTPKLLFVNILFQAVKVDLF